VESSHLRVVLQELEADGLHATAITLSLAGNLVFESNLKSGHSAVFALKHPGCLEGQITLKTAEVIDAMESCKDARAPKLLNTLQHQGLRRTRDGAKRRAENIWQRRTVVCFLVCAPFLFVVVHNKNMTLH